MVELTVGVDLRIYTCHGEEHAFRKNWDYAIADMAQALA